MYNFYPKNTGLLRTRHRLHKILLIMKFTIIILAATILHVSASSFAQKITLAEKNAPLVDVFNKISDQTGYDFLFAGSVLKNAKLVTISVKNEELSDVLTKIFKEQPLYFALDNKSVVISQKEERTFDKIKNALQIPIMVSGVVSDTTGTPLVGATVINATSGKAMVTNDKGEFTLTAESGDQITISYIGYSSYTFTAANGLQIQHITLHPVYNKLTEVVVSTGYQDLPKERATGSFSVVDRKTLEQQVGTDILSRLEATASGLTIDRSTSNRPQYIIRGLSTIQGPRAPLVVLDNFPYEGDINNINPNDIESLTVLKDAAAASVWGARAGNGVIVITTRKARFNQPVSTDFNAFVSTAAQPDLNYLRQMSSADFIDVEQQLYSKGFYNDWINSNTHRVLSDVVELLRSPDANTASRIARLRTRDVRDELNKYVYQRSFNQQYALSLKGGTANSNWTASTGYDRNISELDALYSRANARFQQVWQPLKSLTLQAGLYYTRTETRAGRQGLGGITQYGNALLPYAQLADEQGNPLALPKSYSSTYLASLNGKGLLDWNYYPLQESRNNSQTGSQQDILINTGLNYKLPLGFDIDLKYLYERQNSDERYLHGAESYYARDLVNSFSQNTTGTLIRNIPAGGILDNSADILSVHNFRGQLNFNRRWGSHALSALAGSELRRSLRTSTASRVYGYNDDILTFGTVDYRTAYPNYISGSLNYVPDGASLSDIRNNFVSSFFNAAYTYQGRYGLSLSARRDASNLFGLRTNDQWNPFYSAGLSWQISDEPFMKMSWLNALKLRATYGISGNIDPAMSAVTTIQYAEASPYTQAPYSRFINYYNPELRWESSKMFNLGLDFRLFGDRLSGSLEYFRKTGSNLFGTALIDYTGGVGNSIVKNVAAMSGDGLDIELHAKVLTGRFSWTPALNLSYYRDRVTQYNLASTQGSSFIGSNPTIAGLTGLPVYSLFAYRWAGLNPQTGSPRGYLQGSVSEDYNQLTGPATQVTDLQYFGSALPTWFGSFNHQFAYQKFSLSISLVYKLGYYFRRSSISYTDLYNNWRGHSDYALRWQSPGDELKTDVPSAIYPAQSSRDAFYLGSAALVEKGDHVRLQYVNLAYEMNRQLQLYINASNLGIIWRANRQGIDPDRNNFNNSYVNPPVFALGLRAHFN